MFRRDVTVVIPTHGGRRELLTAAFASAIEQTHPPTAVVVQYDAEGRGAAWARNEALKSVRTHWVAFLDSDDLLYSNHLQVCLDAAQESGADLVYPYFDILGSHDVLATSQFGRVVNPEGVPFGPEQERWLRHRGGFIPVTHLCRTDRIKKAGGFPQPNSFPVPEGNVSADCEDYGLLLRLLDRGARFHHVPVRTWVYRVHAGNTGGRRTYAPAQG
jgi:glycosyltransferase involved in cell wall biosynthesis